MSNIVNIIRTKFIDIKSGEESLGYRIYDDYASAYNNTIEGKIPDDDGELLRLVSNEGNDVQREMLHWALEHGIDIDDTFYEAKEVQEMLGQD
jgi:hypothetical protein